MNNPESKIENRKSKIQNSKSVHLVGVAGVGMSALAQVLRAQGYAVSGSDRYLDSGQTLEVLDKLRLAGVALAPQDGRAVTAGLNTVVVSTAIEPGNADLEAARRLGIPIVHRAEMLARLADGRQAICVTGTAGKTTVTGMIGWILACLGADPMVVNGGAVLNWVNAQTIGNVRVGRSPVWILEVDESDRSLLHFDPDWAVITNISKDHFELAEVQALFDAFAVKVKRGIVGCLGPPEDRKILRQFNPGLTAAGSTFEYRGVVFQVPLLGRHNAENALQSVMLCARLDYPLDAIRKALAGFKGIQRRLELIGQTHGITVIDDYAHNPAKLAAAWQAVAPFHNRVLAVWRPHGFIPLALMHKELADVFARVVRPADRLFVLPVYFAGGTVQRAMTAEDFARDLQIRRVPAEWIGGYAELQERLRQDLRAGDLVLFLGARDPFLPLFVRRFFAELADFFLHRVPGAGGITQENQPA